MVKVAKMQADTFGLWICLLGEKTFTILVTICKQYNYAVHILFAYLFSSFVKQTSVYLLLFLCFFLAVNIWSLVGQLATWQAVPHFLPFEGSWETLAVNTAATLSLKRWEDGWMNVCVTLLHLYCYTLAP